MDISPEQTAKIEMLSISKDVRDLVLRQPPRELLGYVHGRLHSPEIFEDDPEVDNILAKKIIEHIQFTLEYLHAVWSGNSTIPSDEIEFDEKLAVELLEATEKLFDAAIVYCSLSSKTETDFFARFTWISIRGHRYQVLEREFFEFVLEPHEAALREVYGVGHKEVGQGIQNISDAFRIGQMTAVEKIRELMSQSERTSVQSGKNLNIVFKEMTERDASLEIQVAHLIDDIFYGGICNMSKHANLPEKLLEDLSFFPGQNTKFFADGEFSGTPLLTLPARERPGIKIEDDFYTTDGQFVRDSAYRAIQWGLQRQKPDYRVMWKDRQTKMVEEAFTKILSNQLRDCQTHSEIFYKDFETGKWCETDQVIILYDVLFVIEAKSGVMPMQSPATSFSTHERVIKELVFDAYKQCERFLNYVHNLEEAPLFKHQEGQYVEVARIRASDFRLIFPIGLTVESFSPFSARSSEIEGVRPIVGEHAFISMSVDDLFVLKRLLPSTGELIHYLSVRQHLAALPKVFLFDEIDYLGAYLSVNRVDLAIEEYIGSYDRLALSDFSDPIDKYFGDPSWEEIPPPSQEYPSGLQKILTALDKFRPDGWIKCDAYLRDLSSSVRNKLSDLMGQLEITLREFPTRTFQIVEEAPLQFFLLRQNFQIKQSEIKKKAQAGCLAVNSSKMNTLLIIYSRPGVIIDLVFSTFRSPTIVQSDYVELKREAETMRRRLLPKEASS